MAFMTVRRALVSFTFLFLVFACMFVLACMCVYMYTYECMCMHMCKSLCARIVYVDVHMSVCMCMCAHMCVCVFKHKGQRTTLGGGSLLPPFLLWKSSRVQHSLCQASWPISVHGFSVCLPSLCRGTDSLCCCVWLYVSSWDSHLGPRACVVNTLPTEPAPQPSSLTRLLEFLVSLSPRVTFWRSSGDPDWAVTTHTTYLSLLLHSYSSKTTDPQKSPQAVSHQF